MTVGLSHQVFNMALFSGPFIATLLLFGVSGTAACADYMAASDCSTDYLNTVSNMTTSQLLNVTFYCRTLNVFKSCLLSACGSWDAIPAALTNAFQQAEQVQNCDSPEDSCADVSKAIDCGTTYVDTLNTTVNIYFNIDLMCQTIGQYRTCLSDACGSWDRVPKEAANALDTALVENNLSCGNGAGLGQCASALLITVALSLAALIFSLG